MLAKMETHNAAQKAAAECLTASALAHGETFRLCFRTVDSTIFCGRSQDQDVSAHSNSLPPNGCSSLQVSSDGLLCVKDVRLESLAAPVPFSTTYRYGAVRNRTAYRRVAMVLCDCIVKADCFTCLLLGRVHNKQLQFRGS